MSARAEYFRQLARKCAAAADAAADPVTKAKFEQEQHQWLLRAEWLNVCRSRSVVQHPALNKRPGAQQFHSDLSVLARKCVPCF
jgi:hypothetical protein